MSALLVWWPVTLTLVAGFVVTLVVGSPLVGSSSQCRSRHLLILSPLVATVLILVWGAMMEHTTDSQSLAPVLASFVVLGLVVVQLLIGIWVVCVMKGYRWFSAFTVALEQWFGLACAFMAGMSVTGDWL